MFRVGRFASQGVMGITLLNHKACNNGNGRFRTCIAKSAEMKSMFSTFDKDAKAKFLQDVSDKGMTPEGMKLHLVETYNVQKTFKTVTKIKEEGDFFTEKELREDDTLEEGDADNIIDKGVTVTCKVTGRIKYWKPKYTMENSQTEEVIEMQRIEAEKESHIKGEPKAKKPKVEKPKEEQNKIVAGELALTEAQITRVDKQIPKLEHTLHELVTSLAGADAPNKKDYVSAGVQTKAKTLAQSLEITIAAAKEVKEKNACTKEAMKTLFEAMKEQTTNAKSLKQKIDSDLEFA